jgi:hypothetical protein
VKKVAKNLVIHQISAQMKKFNLFAHLIREMILRKKLRFQIMQNSSFKLTIGA